MTPPWPRSAAPLERAVGLFLILIVVGVYSSARKHHGWPPGHPWSGITLTLLGLQPLIWPSTRGAHISRGAWAVRIVALGLTVAGAVMWFLSARAAAPVNVGL